jgi:tape measure domain-containing protein
MEVQATKITIPVVTNAQKANVDMMHLDSTLSRIDKTTMKTERTFSLLKGSLLAVGVSAAAGFGMMAKSAIKGAAALEQNQIALTTMLQSSERANKLLKEMRSMGAATPFETNDLINASKKMIAFGYEAENVRGELTKIGDLAAGVGQPIGDLATIFGKAKLSVNLYAEDLNQLHDRGIPAATELGKVLGVSASQVKKLASEGKVSFKTLQKALDNMTKKGGQFAGMMAKQSKTLTGLWSTFKSNVQESATSLGTFFLPQLKAVVKWLVDTSTAVYNWLSNSENLNRVLSEAKTILKSIGIAAGIVAAGYIAIFTVQKAMIAMQWVKYLWMMRAAILKNVTATNLWAGAQKLLNIFLNANPIGLIILGIAALTGAIYFLIKNWDLVKYTFQSVVLSVRIGLLKMAQRVRLTVTEIAMQFDKLLTAMGKPSRLVQSFILANVDVMKQNQGEIKKLKDQQKTLDAAYAASQKKRDRQSKKQQDNIKKTMKTAAKGGKGVQDAFQKLNKSIQDIGGRVVGMFSNIGAAIQAAQQAQITALDSRMQAELKAAGVAEQTTKEQAQREYDAAVATGNALEIEEKRRALVKAKIEEKYLKKKQDLEYKAAMTAWGFQLAAATAQGALAVLNSFAAGAKISPLLGAVYAGIAGAAAAAQIAAVAAAKPQAPAAQFGGSFMVPPGNEADSGLIKVNQGERVDVSPVSKSGQGGKMILQIGQKDFEGYLTDMMNKIANSGNFKITRQGVVKAV